VRGSTSRICLRASYCFLTSRWWSSSFSARPRRVRWRCRSSAHASVWSTGSACCRRHSFTTSPPAPPGARAPGAPPRPRAPSLRPSRSADPETRAAGWGRAGWASSIAPGWLQTWSRFGSGFRGWPCVQRRGGRIAPLAAASAQEAANEAKCRVFRRRTGWRPHRGHTRGRVTLFVTGDSRPSGFARVACAREPPSAIYALSGGGSRRPHPFRGVWPAGEPLRTRCYIRRAAPEAGSASNHCEGRLSGALFVSLPTDAPATVISIHTPIYTGFRWTHSLLTSS